MSSYKILEEVSDLKNITWEEVHRENIQVKKSNNKKQMRLEFDRKKRGVERKFILKFKKECGEKCVNIQIPFEGGNKEWYENNKEAIAKKSKTYRELNKEKKQNKKKNYQNNKEAIAKKSKTYRELNKDKIKEYKKQYSKANKDKIKEKAQEKIEFLIAIL